MVFHDLLPSRLLTSDLLDPELSFAGARGQQNSVAQYLASITLGEPGRCSHKPVLETIITDNSGSITGGNDPVGLRFQESFLAIRRVGARCRCGKDLVSSFSFDTPTSLDLEPTPITRTNLKKIKDSLAVPSDGGGSSCLSPSLQKTFRMAGQYRRSHHLVLVVLSDFELCDTNPLLVTTEMNKYPGDVHAVVLRSEPPPVLLAATNVTVTRVDHDSPAGTVARAVFTGLAATRPGSKPKAPEQPEPWAEVTT